MLRTVLFSFAIAALPTPSQSQSNTPMRRGHHALVYDETRGAVLLTGGSTPLDGGQRFQFFNDLWSLGDSGWRLVGESGEQLSGMGLAWDSSKRQVISFAGYNGRSIGDVRRLESDRWKLLGKFSEVAVAEPGFVYDSRRNLFVAFGGSSGPGSTYQGTWEYDGNGWKPIAVPGPPARQAHAMAYDARRGRTVVFGGMGDGPQGKPRPVLGDTWEYDGTGWTQRQGPAPPPRQAPGVAYDSRRGLVIIFGGLGEKGFLGDTWSWDGSAWKQLASSGPEPRAMGYLAYDQRRDRVVMFGGRKGWPDGDLSDTWEWDGASWRQRP